MMTNDNSAARYWGYESTQEFLSDLLEAAYQAADLSLSLQKAEEDLANTRRRLDLALLNEKTARAELRKDKTKEQHPASDEDTVGDIVDRLIQATALKVEQRVTNPESVEGKTNVNRRLT